MDEEETHASGSAAAQGRPQAGSAPAATGTVAPTGAHAEQSQGHATSAGSAQAEAAAGTDGHRVPRSWDIPDGPASALTSEVRSGPLGRHGVGVSSVSVAPLAGCPQLPFYFARESVIEEEEKDGTLEFREITNNGDERSLVWLIDLKNIFSEQLPKMPKEYIVRLVLDRCARAARPLPQSEVARPDPSVAVAVVTAPSRR